MLPRSQFLRDRQQQKRQEKRLQGPLQAQPEECESDEASSGRQRAQVEDDEAEAESPYRVSNSRALFQLPQLKRNRKLSQPIQGDLALLSSQKLDGPRPVRKMSQPDMPEKQLVRELNKRDDRLQRVEEGQKQEDKLPRAGEKLQKHEDQASQCKHPVDKLLKAETQLLKGDAKPKAANHLSPKKEGNVQELGEDFNSLNPRKLRWQDLLQEKSSTRRSGTLETADSKQSRKGDTLKWLGRRLRMSEDESPALQQPVKQQLLESTDTLARQAARIHQLQKIQEESQAFQEEEQKKAMKLRQGRLFPTDRQLRLRSVIGRGWLRLPLATARSIADIELEKVSTVLQRWESLQLAETLRLHGASQRLRCLEKSLAGDGMRSCRMCGLRFGAWSRCLMAVKDGLRLLRRGLRRSGSGWDQVVSTCSFCGLRFCTECLPPRADLSSSTELPSVSASQSMKLLCEVCLQRNRLATETGSWQTRLRLRVAEPAASVACVKSQQSSAVRCHCCIGSAIAIRRSQLRPLNVAMRK